MDNCNCRPSLPHSDGRRLRARHQNRSLRTAPVIQSQHGPSFRRVGFQPGFQFPLRPARPGATVNASPFMKEKESPTSRRSFLKSTLTLPVALAAAPSLFAQNARAADAPAPAAGEPLPRRQLGKNGPQVTMLGMGGMMGAFSPDFIDLAWSMGIRYFDTAHSYINGKSERILAAWLAK